jgi:hypothetical protein
MSAAVTARRWLALAALLGPCAGCASTSSLLAKRFATAHGCDASDVHVSEQSAQAYSADGCGQHADYVCESFAGMNADASRCVERGAERGREGLTTRAAHPELEAPK